MKRCAVIGLAVLTGLLGWAVPAAALPARSGGSAAGSSVTVPVCQIGSPETITGAQFVNSQFVNGTWSYATGVACTSNLADIALYEELDLNGTKVDSRTEGFTGTARDIAAITSSYFCAECNGTWLFKWGQILKAPSGLMFTSASAGCVLLDSGIYEACVQTKTVTL